MNIEKLVKIVASRAKNFEELQKSGENWLKMFLENGWIKKGYRILDYGAGLGRISIPFSKIADVTAVDGNKEMVKFLKSKKIKASCLSNLDDLNFNKKFDFIISIYVLQHIHFPNAQKLVTKMAELTDTLYFTYPIEEDGCPDSYINYKQSYEVPVEDSSDVSRKMKLEELPILFEHSDFDPNTIKRLFSNLFVIKKI